MDEIACHRKQVISQFADIIVDMDYLLCVPSVHAMYRDEEMVVDFGGRIRYASDGFPQDRSELLLQWVAIHKDEIVRNHMRINSELTAPLPIEPLIIP